MNLVGIIIVLTGIALSIALHEVGHMLPAKKFGVKVTQFMVGFGPSLWTRQKGETEYGIKAIPLGGYVRMIGMFPPRRAGTKAAGKLRRAIEEARADSLAEVAPEDESRVFWRLKTWQKVTVMAGGPMVNLLLAGLFLSIALYGIGIPRPSTTVASLVACVPTSSNPEGEPSPRAAGSASSCPGGRTAPAAAMGVQPGDRILSINGASFATWQGTSEALQSLKSAPVELTVDRGGKRVTLRGTTAEVRYPVRDEAGNPTGAYETYGFLGFRPKTEYVAQPPAAMPRALWGMSVESVKALGSFPSKIYDLGRSLFTNTPRDVNGPVSVVGVVDIGGQLASSGEPGRDVALNLLGLLASLNLFLFLFNLVPLPPLDGGHVAGALWEGVRRGVARMRRAPAPAPVDTAAMLPIAYVAAACLLLMSLVVILADVIKPLHLPG